jgi:MoaA/NifB/PqqE/SkfB family radical SAM enzyme
MDRGLYERLLLEMRDAGVEEIGLFYLGESFLVPWLHEAVYFAKHVAEFPYVFLTTNGSLSTPKRVGKCMAAGLDSLKFSLNYADAQQFVEIARVKAVLFDRMIANIKGAWELRRAHGYQTGLYASYIQYDGAQGEKMAGIIKEIEPFVDELYALPLYNQANLVTAEEKARGWSYTAGNRGRVDALREPIPCWAVFTEGHCTWDGKLSACCFDHNEELTMGDLTKQSFMDAWHSPGFRRLRLAHMNRHVAGTPCMGCLAYQM